MGEEEVKLGIQEVKEGVCRVLGGIVFLGKIIPPAKAYEILEEINRRICKSD